MTDPEAEPPAEPSSEPSSQLSAGPSAEPPARVVYLAPHPDDETLSMGAAIAASVGAGLDVHVVSVTQGGASIARDVLNGVVTAQWWGLPHDPDAEGYPPLDEAALKAARATEFRAACSALGVPAANVHVHDLPDGGVTADDVAALVLETFAVPGAPATAYRTLSHRWEAHRDHLACGTALLDLRRHRPDAFSDVGWYVFRPYWPDAGADPRAAFEVPGAVARQRVLNACRAYSGWAPGLGHFACGYHSVGDEFALLEADVRALAHRH